MLLIVLCSFSFIFIIVCLFIVNDYIKKFIKIIYIKIK